MSWLPKSLSVIVFLGLLAGCQTEPAEQTGTTEETAAPDAASVRATIEEIGDRFEQALLAEDAVAVASFYAEDAVVLPPGSPRTEGRANIEAMFASWFEQTPPTEGFTLTSDDVQLSSSGELAYEVGTYTMRGTTPDGQAYDETGKYLAVWENAGGEWKMVADQWSGDAPMHAGEGAEAPAGAPEAAEPAADAPAE